MIVQTTEANDQGIVGDATQFSLTVAAAKAVMGLAKFLSASHRVVA